MPKDPLPARVDNDRDNDNNDNVELPPDSVSALGVSAGEKVRQGRGGDNLIYILAFSLASAAALLAAVILLFSR